MSPEAFLVVAIECPTETTSGRHLVWVTAQGMQSITARRAGQWGAPQCWEQKRLVDSWREREAENVQAGTEAGL